MRLEYPTYIQEDTEDYMEQEHFEDICLPDRDTPPMMFDQEDSLEIHHVMQNETIRDYLDDGNY